MPGDSLYALPVKSEQDDCASESSEDASPLLQTDEESDDELPTYINELRSSKYMNI